MCFNHVSFIIKFIQLDKKSPEFDSIVAISDVLQEHMSDIFLEDMKSEDKREEISDFVFKKNPKLMLFS